MINLPNLVKSAKFMLNNMFLFQSAVDLGGPRKEFFSLVLKEIQEEYFNPVKEWSGDYEVIGKIMGKADKGACCIIES